jgi:hypothetical protein
MSMIHAADRYTLSHLISQASRRYAMLAALSPSFPIREQFDLYAEELERGLAELPATAETDDTPWEAPDFAAQLAEVRGYEAHLFAHCQGMLEQEQPQDQSLLEQRVLADSGRRLAYLDALIEQRLWDLAGAP